MDSRVRIIGGRWKRSLLAVPDLQGLRPTPDRVRESLFNWLGQDLTGWRCLDLFAGTGVLGFEAASRGAAQVTMVERHPKLARSLETVRSRLDAVAVRVVRADVPQWLRSMPPQPYDLVLLDPPYHAGWLDRLLPIMPAWLEPQGRLYVESEYALSDAALAGCGAEGLEVIRAAKAGQVHYHLLALKDAPAPALRQQHNGEA
jgi:16S rRNA (guanine(966)-N(2))-methyltransferase RsmD